MSTAAQTHKGFILSSKFPFDLDSYSLTVKKQRPTLIRSH